MALDQKVSEDRRSFEERAKDFLMDLANGEGFRLVYREGGHDVSELKVGIEKHQGLVFKNGKFSHATMAIKFYDLFIRHFKERGYDPYSYQLVRPNFLAAGDILGIVQDYFDGPSLTELTSYFQMVHDTNKIEAQRGANLEPAEIQKIIGRYLMGESSLLRCKQFLEKASNISVTREQTIDVRRELLCDASFLRLYLKTDNVIAVDQIREGDLNLMGLVIVDY